MATLTETLRSELSEHSQKLKQLSRDSGLDYAVLWRWLNRERQIFGDTADRLAAHFNLTLVDQAAYELDRAELRSAREEIAHLRRGSPKKGSTPAAAENVRGKMRSALRPDFSASVSAGRSPFRGDRGKCERCEKRRLICDSCKLCAECGHGPLCTLSPLEVK
jgi:hypothetical protein